LITDPLDYLYSLERLGMKFGLDNITRLCAALSHPERSFKSVHIAGTNGKGSVTAMVHRGLLEAGVRAARYTSPHLERLEERFVIGHDEIDTTQLRAAVGRVQDAADALQRSGAMETPPTFFECATAAAFESFRDARVEVAVLEVGLGGRLDATNVVLPIVTAITSIGFDHQLQLGDTLESIAFEKAGIIKRGVPLVCGAVPAAAESVITAVCRERNAPLIRASECAWLERWIGTAPLGLAGDHQRGNATVAACVLRSVDATGLAVGDAAIRAGLVDVCWPGRLERVRSGSADVLLDAAHNADGARALATYLRDTGWTDCALIFGVMRDKAVPEMLEALSGACAALICTTARTPRAMPAPALAAIAGAAGARWPITTVDDPAEAIRLATRDFSRVVVAGSIFLTGPARGILRPR
jgi:dihydrofolate synthase / folylpolyglutamate synthase